MTVSATWVAWLVASLILLLSTRNPIYLFVIIILLFILGARQARRKGRHGWVHQNLRFTGTMLILSALINTLFTHTGQTELFVLPDEWLLIGGPFTLESLLYGAVNGLVISALYLLFDVFNLSLSIKQITRLIPHAFRPLTVMTTVSLTFFPAIQERTRHIREAQMIRGNPMEKISDWLPILAPLLVGSLEDALLLSESMTARGFHARNDQPDNRLVLVGLILVVFAAFSGWLLRLFAYPTWISILLYSLGAVVLVVVLATAGKAQHVTSLHQDDWRRQDELAFTLLMAAGLGLIVTLVTKLDAGFSYTPFPRLDLPEVTLIGLCLSLIPGIPLLFKHHD
ncbi:MAG: energy-coupling factor transporter transmembrane component T [Chloroflexota bacterium]|nr:energy-coupling factor transporter transmembrane component T [Chloroflexota bacterium]